MKRNENRYLGGKKQLPDVEVPHLLTAQLESYRNFLQEGVPDDQRRNAGLESAFRKIFPIYKNNETLRVDYCYYTLDEPLHSADECKAAGTTYGSILRVALRIVKEKEKREGAGLVSARETKKGHEVFLGVIPLMTERGTFVINGVERVIISRLQRSPGVYFKEESVSPREYSARVIPARGIWLDFRFDGGNMLNAYLGKKKVLASTLFSALGHQSARKLTATFFPGGRENDGYELWQNTLEKRPLDDQEANLLEIYTLLRPGYPTSRKKAGDFLEQLFFSEETYELGEAGRSQLNKKLGRESGCLCLEHDDIVGTVRYLFGLYRGEGSVDDVDHLGNKRVRMVGELVTEQVEIGLARLARLVRDRLNLLKNEEPTPQELVNSRTFAATVKDFFARSPYSQLLDQTNPLSELTHKRRMTSIGEGVFADRKRIGFEIRDVHYTHYGRICPIETPEGGNIGILTSLATHAQVDNLGFLRTPYRKVDNGRVTDSVVYLSADEEDDHRVAPANIRLRTDRSVSEREVMVRYWDDFIKVAPDKIAYLDVSPLQMVSVAASLIPFLEHDDANRALMGANMQRQALPLLKPQAPLVRTGSEDLVTRDSNTVLRALEDGTVTAVDARHIRIARAQVEPGDFDTETIYRLSKFEHMNQDTVFNQRPLVSVGQQVRKGDILTDGPSVDSTGSLALGRNVLVAFIPWYGYNFEDAIAISEKLAREDAYTSIHITEFDVDARDTELGPEEITRDIPNVAEDLLANLDEEGIVRIGAHVKPNDILVGKITPKSETDPTPEERLLRVIFGEKAREVDNTSLYVPPGVSGVVINVKKLERAREKTKNAADSEDVQKRQQERKERISVIEDELKTETRRLLLQAIGRLGEICPEKAAGLKPHQARVLAFKADDPARQPAVDNILATLDQRLEKARVGAQKKIQQIKQGDELKVDILRKIVIQLAIKKPVSVGDKMSGRHGNKGVIARIVPEADMPFMPDGTPVEIVINPLGVPSRMNVGQILETHLGWAAKALGLSITTPIFNSADEKRIAATLEQAGLPGDGKTTLLDGMTGEPLRHRATCGYIYMMKLFHLADDKIHARSVGSYSLVTQQPLGGRAQFGGQRFGEMEVWALEGYGASNLLQEILTVKSDDMVGRKKVYENIVKDRDFDDYQTPESFNVLINELKGLGFDIRTITRPDGSEAVSIHLASPDTIRKWSHGEVKKPETINYRSFKAEKDGLFCEKIFGPTKDWECACGKYKKVKHRGIICDRCGVEVTTSDVRRTRMGHIELAAPVSYVWIFKSVYNWMGTLLGMSQNALELILYYERYVVLEPGDSFYDDEQKKAVNYRDLLEEKRYQELKAKYPQLQAEIGAIAVHSLLQNVDLKAEEAQLMADIEENKANQERRRNFIKKLRIVKGLISTNTRPEWMITSQVPVIPPNLRPLLPMEGGRFAASDLNDLYQRIINRNNRLKRLKKLHAPDIIIRNEQRMLQEAVDALFDNGRHGAQFLGRSNRPLKSLADALRGKQGRFRQNLLGKRVDYSGRAVIVAGPELKLNECGVPKHMALELFAPFILRELRYREYIHTIASAKRALERNDPAVWEILEEVTRRHPVLLNRQPTLHRLSIQSFMPRLIEGNVIRLHPLVCAAFNADFDGDQMAIHVPLSIQAQLEARLLLNAAGHLFSPCNGQPVPNLSREALLGCYYLTLVNRTLEPAAEIFCGPREVLSALESGFITCHEPIRVLLGEGEQTETTAGRVLFNELLPPAVPYCNKLIDRKVLEQLIGELYQRCGQEQTARFLDEAKQLGFRAATQLGLTIGIEDLVIPQEKPELIQRFAREIARIRRDYDKGAITEGERYHKVIDTWSTCTNMLADKMFAEIEAMQERDFVINPIFLMVQSGARGNRQQVSQLMAMRGLMTKPTKKITGGIGEIIESPVLANFREGLNVLEYFISTHGGRKGLVDTALKTSDSGYLSRRLVDVSQDMVVSIDDCGTTTGIMVAPVWEGDRLMVSLRERIIGRVAISQVTDIVTDQVIARANEEITEEAALQIEEMGIEKIQIRSALTCKAERGVCRKCYGWNMSIRRMVDIGEAVGVVAAQSIGEPGTQLTLRTFHIGGTASRIVGERRVNARREGTVKFKDLRSETNAAGEQVALNRDAVVAILDQIGREVDHYPVETGDVLKVSDGQEISQGQVLIERDPYMVPIVAEKSGYASFQDLLPGITYKEDSAGTGTTHKVIIAHKVNLTPIVVVKDSEGNKLDSHYLPVDAHLIAREGEAVTAGDTLAKTPRITTRQQDITGGLPRVSELFEARKPKNPAILSEIDGVIAIEINERNQRVVKVRSIASDEERSYLIPVGRHLLVTDGSFLLAGGKITEGSSSLDDLLRIGGEKMVSEYLLNEVQSVYRLEGVSINDKHIECIIRQMLSRVRIDKSGDTLFTDGEVVSKNRAQRENERILENEGQPAQLVPLVLGITRVALMSESFISAASFQETLRILTDAALMGLEDPLLGTKENVILGRIIPAGTGFFPKPKKKPLEEKDPFEVHFGGGESDPETPRDSWDVPS